MEEADIVVICVRQKDFFKTRTTAKTQYDNPKFFTEIIQNLCTGDECKKCIMRWQKISTARDEPATVALTVETTWEMKLPFAQTKTRNFITRIPRKRQTKFLLHVDGKSGWAVYGNYKNSPRQRTRRDREEDETTYVYTRWYKIKKRARRLIGEKKGPEVGNIDWRRSDCLTTKC